MSDPKKRGPKIVAMRHGFADPALESRFLTEEMGKRPLATSIPINLPDAQREALVTQFNRDGCAVLPGKLPADCYEVKYSLEYGHNSLAIHRDAIGMGERVLIVDDLLATGGTAEATVNLVRQLGGEIVGLDFLVELKGLNGRDKLAGYEVHSTILYP